MVRFTRGLKHLDINALPVQFLYFCASNRAPSIAKGIALSGDNQQVKNILATLNRWASWAAPKLPLVILLLIFVYPLGGYLMWRGKHFPVIARWVITGLLILWTFVLLSPTQSYDPYGELGGSCSASFTQNGCTYFRDDNCNVIAQSCN